MGRANDIGNEHKVMGLLCVRCSDVLWSPMIESLERGMESSAPHRYLEGNWFAHEGAP